MKASFDINVDNKELNKRIEKEINTIMQEEIRKQFRVKTDYHDSGEAHKFVQGKVAEYVQQNLNEDTLRIFFEKNWDAFLEEALRKALTHKANAVAFKMIKTFKS